MKLRYTCEATEGAARAGQVKIGEKEFFTPAFMPVATLGAVRTVTAAEVAALGSRILLGNALHLHVRPGEELVEKCGGLHRFMGWPHLILTDSGGYQVFSLSEIRHVREEGVEFKNPFDGANYFVGPEEAIEIQRRLGSDIVMAFDECPPHPAPREEVQQAVERTDRWLARCVAQSQRGRPLNLFGIVQGGVHRELRRQSLERTLEYPLAGLAVGGLSVGEESGEMYAVLDDLQSRLPADRPRYLMGVGTPENLIEAVARGIDMFDCVLPTRNARNGSLFTGRGKVVISHAQHKEATGPIEEGCACPACRGYSRAYLRHLFMAKEMLALRLFTLHNLHFYLELMRRMRAEIIAGTFAAFRRQALTLLEQAVSSSSPNTIDNKRRSDKLPRF